MAIQPKKTTVFEDLITKANNAKLDVSSEKARAWFRQQAKNVNVPPSRLLNATEYRGKLNNSIGIGQMFLFSYDPKTKHVSYYSTIA